MGVTAAPPSVEVSRYRDVNVMQTLDETNLDVFIYQTLQYIVSSKLHDNCHTTSIWQQSLQQDVTHCLKYTVGLQYDANGRNSQNKVSITFRLSLPFPLSTPSFRPLPPLHPSCHARSAKECPCLGLFVCLRIGLFRKLGYG